MTDDNQVNEFQAAAEDSRTNILQEFWGFLNSNKKWWLTPIILVILLVGLLVLFAGSGGAPFIYALF